MEEIELPPSTILRTLADLTHQLLSGGRGGNEELPPPWEWDEKTPVGKGGLEADSIERLTLCAGINRMYHLHEAGIEDYLLRAKSIGEWAEIVEEGRKRNSKAITFTTSGTTGEPKPCAHSWAGLLQEIDFLQTLFPHARRIIRTLPCHHIYGFLFTVLLPLQMKIPVTDLRGRSFSGLASGDLIVSFPLYWRYLVDSGIPFPKEVFGVTSTAPCPEELPEQLKSQNLQRLTQIYGSSETGGIGHRTEPESPFQLFPHWKKAGEEKLLRTLHDPKKEEPVTLQDRLNWMAEDRFLVLGRRDCCIQVGGINVSPEAVAEKICGHPLVESCSVWPGSQKPEPRVSAEIILQKGTFPTPEVKKALRQWLRENLPPAQRPTDISFKPSSES